MAIMYYNCDSLTGGSDALDAIKYVGTLDSLDGAYAFCWDTTHGFCPMYWDSSASDAESLPSVVAPNDIGANNGRWKLLTYPPSVIDHDSLDNFTATEHQTSAVIRVADETLRVKVVASDPVSPTQGDIILRSDL